VPVGSKPLPLDVFCVEHGRWSSGASFTDAKTIVHPSVREQATLQRDQRRVWNAVRSGNDRGGESICGRGEVAAPRIARTIQDEAPTESYQKFTSRAKCEAPWKCTWRKCRDGSQGKPRD